MNTEQQFFTAVVLAADREEENPVARAAGVRCKSLAPINGTPMIFRVLEALSSSCRVQDRVLCGPPKIIMDQEPELNGLVTAGKVDWLENQATPSLSAYHAMTSLPEGTTLMLTTSDHALLSPRVIDYFCNAAQESGCDVVAGVAQHETVVAAYPETHRTAYRFKDGSYCSCNLFAFLTPQARQASNFWRRIEQQRKNPLRVINELGLMTVLRYLMGRLTFAEAVDRISQRLGFKAGLVTLPFPEAAIDVDSVSDWHFVEQIATTTSV
jgi:molybdopterin-guanine dinucleotide biosynthesis protein A